MQGIKRRYDRFFIMFKQELSGYSIDGREPNGYCKIEIRDGKGRANTYMQGLKPLKDGSMYRVYLIAVQGNKSLGVPTGWLDIDNRGRGECRFDFNPDNIDETGLAIEDFNVGAIIVKGDNIKELIAPIVGYRDKEVLWKKGFKDFSNYKAESNHKAEKEKNLNDYLEIDIPEEVKQRFTPSFRVPNTFEEETKESIPKQAFEQQENVPTEVKEDISPIKPMPRVEHKIEPKIEPKVEYKPEPKIEPRKIEPRVEHKPEFKSESKKIDNSSISEIKDEDTQVDPQKIFNDMVNKFYAEMEELEKYKLLTPEDTKILDLEFKPDEEIVDDLTYMFKNNEKIIPFERSNKAIQWIKIAPFELVTLNLHAWTYIKHQFINAAWKKYKYLILGRYFQNNGYNYILGIPDLYNDKYKAIAQNLGFKKFVCCKGRVIQDGSMGYWIMEI